MSELHWTPNGAILETIERARTAQQEHDQRHDVQLQLFNLGVDNAPRDRVRSNAIPPVGRASSIGRALVTPPKVPGSIPGRGSGGRLEIPTEED